MTSNDKYMNNLTAYYVAFSHFEGLGPYAFTKLLTRFKTPDKAFNAPESQLRHVFSPGLLQKFLQFRNSTKPYSLLQLLLDKGVQIVHRNSSEWPKQFEYIRDPPICLYCKGNAKLLGQGAEKLLAVVGTRKPSSYGKYVTKLFTQELAQHFTIVSGLATGIDALAHSIAIKSPHSTIAVLGCSINKIYPQANARLFKEILDNNGLIISEFPPGVTIFKGNFVSRNRLISGLSRGVLLVEGGKDSGTLTTAKLANNQGRDVFCIPQSITSPLSVAPNLYIREGGIAVSTPDHILQEYKLAPTSASAHKSKLPVSDVPQENAILSHLTTAPYHPDDISNLTKLPVTQTLMHLTNLEIKGVIAKNEQGEYYIA